MAHPPPDIQELRNYLKTLPQELRDEIQTFVFTADSQKRFVDKRYKPPASLQISRATRKQFAKSYYGNGVFVFEGNPSPKPTAVKLVRHLTWKVKSWLRLIGEDYRRLVKSFEFVLLLSDQLHGDERLRTQVRGGVIVEMGRTFAGEVQVVFVDYFHGARCDVGRVVCGD